MWGHNLGKPGPVPPLKPFNGERTARSNVDRDVVSAQRGKRVHGQPRGRLHRAKLIKLEVGYEIVFEARDVALLVKGHVGPRIFEPLRQPQDPRVARLGRCLRVAAVGQSWSDYW